jgi:hypothetical protein
LTWVIKQDKRVVVVVIEENVMVPVIHCDLKFSLFRGQSLRRKKEMTLWSSRIFLKEAGNTLKADK